MKVGINSRRVVGQIQEQADIVHGSVLLEIRLEETGRLHVDLKEISIELHDLETAAEY